MRTSFAGDLRCWTCKRTYTPTSTRMLCDCGGPLEQTYDVERLLAEGRGGAGFLGPLPGIWRYASLLPVQDATHITTLSEGRTPLVPLVGINRRYGIDSYVKDEGRNPTGSFKARGASVAVSRLAELGCRGIGLTSVGSGASAWSAYAARAGLPIRIGMPADEGLPRIGVIEPPMYGAEVTRGPYPDFRAGLTAEFVYGGALQEPYRVEGEKTVLMEIAESMSWRLPDYVVWPTGGAAGLVGLAKASEELSMIGLLRGADTMTIVSAQHSSAAPVATALRDGLAAPPPGHAGGIAPGVSGSEPFGGSYVVDRVRAAAAVDGDVVDDDDILAVMTAVSREEGLLLSPEGALTVAVMIKLREAGRIGDASRVVCVNTAAGLRYPHLLEHLASAAPPTGAMRNTLA